MTQKLIENLIMEGIAALMFAFAYQIGVKGRMDFIAGYNEKTASQVTDKDGLKRLITRLCVLLGVASAIMPALTSLAAGHHHGLAYVIGGYGWLLLAMIAVGHAA